MSRKNKFVIIILRYQISCASAQRTLLYEIGDPQVLWKCHAQWRTETLIFLLSSWETLSRSMLVNTKIKSKNGELFCFHLLFYSFRCWLTCVNQGGECVRKLFRHCGGKTRHVIRELNCAWESRNCVVVRGCGADRLCRLNVDHRNF